MKMSKQILLIIATYTIATTPINAAWPDTDEEYQSYATHRSTEIQNNKSTQVQIVHHKLSNDEMLQMVAKITQKLSTLYFFIEQSPETLAEFKRLAAELIILGTYIREKDSK